MVRVVKDENIQDQAFETSNGETQEAADHAARSQEGEAGDTPFEEMTKEVLVEKLREAEAAAQKNYDLYLRSQADMENLKKRYQKENQGLIKFANETLIKQLLPVADNLEKAIEHLQEEEASVAGVREGVELTLKMLMDVLQRSGVEVIQALGEPFDPRFHEAVSEEMDEQAEPGTVIKEMQRGYTLHQRLLRPSMVVVCRNTP